MGSIRERGSLPDYDVSLLRILWRSIVGSYPIPLNLKEKTNEDHPELPHRVVHLVD
jgi:hypothetical protein